jgi:ATP/ADP translocase/HEAT repeat protein
MPPLTPRTVRRRLGLESGEGGMFLLMGGLVALLLGAYTLAKVMRDALYLDQFGARNLPWMYVAVAVASALFVGIESLLARRIGRGWAGHVSQWLAIGISIMAALTYPVNPRLTALWFYVWTGSQAMMLLPHFWVLALDVWDSHRARRLFPVLSGFGLLGGLAGGGVAAWLTPVIQRTGLLWMLSALLVACHLLTLVVRRRRARPRSPSHSVTPLSFRQVIRRSTYIKVLAAALALSAVVSTMVDFQFKYFIKEIYQDPHDLTSFLGKFYVGLNVLALVFQFGASGWLLQRLGLGASTGIQPSTVIVFATMTALSSGFWAVVALRWIQGVVFQTLGKSSSEIYFAAIRPRERRLVKPAVDTLVERWSDAAAGVLLIIALHVLRVPIAVIAAMTAVIAAVWLVVLLRLNHDFGKAFQEALSTRWIEAETPPEAIRTPSARKALLDALQQNDARRIVLALRLSEQVGGSKVASAVRGCLRHADPAVRAAALQAMEAQGMPDRDGTAAALMADPEEVVRRAAVSYRLASNARPAAAARELLDRNDPALDRMVLDALWAHPWEVRNAVQFDWIDARIAGGTVDGAVSAARALGTRSGREAATRLKPLLERDDAEVRTAALLAAARRPDVRLVAAIQPLLLDPACHVEARQAMAAHGNAAVGPLSAMLAPDRPARERAIAARALAEIASPRAIGALMTLVRSTDLDDRRLGLRNLGRARGLFGKPVLTRSLAHRLFLRELRDYRACIDAADGLHASEAAELRLLGESYRESADTALERALLALAAWYEPRPLYGAFQRLACHDIESAAPALEFLGHALPRPVFRPLAELFDRRITRPAEDTDTAERLAGWIRGAWESGDDWLRACAVRAARLVPGLAAGFVPRADESPLVLAELEALAALGPAAAPVVSR